MQDEKRFYVYVHRRKTDGRIFYVGVGANQRVYSHSSRNPHWHNAVRKYGKKSEIVKRFDNKCCALTYEKLLISIIGIDNLTNISHGGDSGNSGIKRSDESNARVSDSLKRHYENPDNRRKCSERLMGRVFSDDSKQKISKSTSLTWSDPIVREKRIQAMVEARQTLEWKERSSLNNSGSNNPLFDSNIYTFQNLDTQEIFIGFRFDFYTKFNLSRSNVASVIKGSRKTVSRWKLLEGINAHT